MNTEELARASTEEKLAVSEQRNSQLKEAQRKKNLSSTK